MYLGWFGVALVCWVGRKAAGGRAGVARRGSPACLWDRYGIAVGVGGLGGRSAGEGEGCLRIARQEGMTDMTEILGASDAVSEKARAGAPGPHFGLTKFADPLRIPPVVRPHPCGQLVDVTVRMRCTQVRMHSQLAPTTVWAFDGHFPGPTFEVRRQQRLRVSWTNDIHGAYPIVAVRVPLSQAPSNSPGYDPASAEVIDGVADLPAWVVVHLHGARTGGGNDGWPHNAVLRNDSQLAEYPNDQPAAALWYHDHAMNITRWNVMTGLAGMYIIRDDEEDALCLPRGRHELPLLISDRNFDTDQAGNLTGQLLYKVAVAPGTNATIPFSGPFTLVNGVIWPHLDVQACWYRFRVLNISNTRFYQLDLIDEHGRSQRHAVHQIGTDGGLLPEPTPLPAAGLILTPSERADLLVDFSQFRGQRLRLTNTAANAAPEPDVMQFRVSEQHTHDRFVLPPTISTSYYRVQHGTTLPSDHDHKWVALVPPGTSGDAHPQMWELAEITDPAQIPTPPPGRTAVDGIIQIKDAAGTVRTFQRVATDFDDTTTFFIDYDRWAIWSFVHVAGPSHPMHIHLTQFQALTRDSYDTQGFNIDEGGTTLVPTPTPITYQQPAVLEEHEKGWKDVIRVDSGELVSVAGQFSGATGNFVYHCHILDHEDEGMMRPFVVMPAQVMRFEHPASGGGHQHNQP
jgi:FtsP/CotA-like multicopper oxidase with cupredoxin domain